MSAIALIRTPRKTEGFARGSTLLYLAVFTAAILIPPALNALPFFKGQPAFIRYSLSFLAGIILFATVHKAVRRGFQKKIRVLTRAVKRYAKGDSNILLPSWKEDSMDVLAGTMVQIIMDFQNQGRENSETNEKLSLILNEMQEGVIGVDSESSVIIHNPSATRILGAAKDGLGRSLIEFTRSPEIDEAVRQAMLNQKALSREIEIQYLEKKILKIHAIGTGQRGLCGILVIHDITAFKNLERTRQEFVANASHELRTPLTSIKGFIETLLAGAMREPEQCEKFLKIMHDDTERLSRLIEDLLDLSSIESRKTILKRELFNIGEEIEKTLQTLDSAAKRKNIRISFTSDRKLPAVYADRDRIRQVLLNLLDNAVKFTPANGSIDITSLVESGGRVQVSVKDTGPGIPENLVPRIFERFFRVDKARSREEGGTGLGLAIAKHIVESHSGQIFCESRPGEGACFRFLIPASPSLS